MKFSHYALLLISGAAQLVSAASASDRPLANFTNPLFPGFNPDPSCIRVDSQFFCATSTFNYFPGIPIYTSFDLVHWTHLGHVLSRPEQLPELAALNGSNSGIWAPGLRYNEGTFYLSTTLVHNELLPDDIKKFDNIVFSTKDIFSGEWSNAVHFSPPFLGYDVSLFWDTDGTSYVHIAHYWRVSPGIWSYVIDLETGEISQGELVWSGTGGHAPEGPHVYLKDGWYYMLLAEGGTGSTHMVTMARSRSVHGPFEAYSDNPVYTNSNTTEYLQDVGHADLFSDTNGNWWACSLAVRNAAASNHPIGRETVLTSVVWETGEFPIFNPSNPKRVTIDMTGPLPASRPLPSDLNVKQAKVRRTFPPGSEIPYEFIFWRLPNASAYEVSPRSHPHTLLLHGSAQNLTGNGQTRTSTFIARRQQHIEFTSTVDLDFNPKVAGEEAGITLFLTPTQHYDLGIVASANGTRSIRLGATSSATKALPNLTDKLTLKVQAVNATTYEFSYAKSGTSSWEILGSGLAEDVSGGYTGTVVGLYATGNGQESTTPAYFSEFLYSGVEGVY